MNHRESINTEQYPEMEFLEINLTKDSSLLLHAIHSLFHWRIFKKMYSSLVLKILTKKSTKKEISSQFMNSILYNQNIKGQKPDKYSSLRTRRLEFMLRNLKKTSFKNSISGSFPLSSILYSSVNIYQGSLVLPVSGYKS